MLRPFGCVCSGLSLGVGLLLCVHGAIDKDVTLSLAGAAFLVAGVVGFDLVKWASK